MRLTHLVKKPSIDKTCFVLITGPDVDPAKPQWACSICSTCPSIKRQPPVGATNLGAHLKCQNHLMAMQLVAARGTKPTEAAASTRTADLPSPVAQRPLPTTYASKSATKVPTLPRLLSPSPSPRPAPVSSDSSNSTNSSNLVVLDSAATAAALKKEDERKKSNAEVKKRREAREVNSAALAKEGDLPRKLLGPNRSKKDTTASDICIKKVEDLVRKHLDKEGDVARDWAHVDRVRRMALEIGKTIPEADLKIIEFLALFHGLAAGSPASRIDLNDVFPLFLNFGSGSTSLTVPQISNILLNLVPAVSRAAETHMRTKKEWKTHHDECIELHVVQDAHRLDAMGATGLMRSVAASAVQGRMLLNDGTTKGVDCAEAQFRCESLLNEYGMKTALGKAKAVKRSWATMAWMEALDAEKKV